MNSSRGSIPVEISPGELLDKLTILSIKRLRIADAERRANVEREYEVLDRARAAHIPDDAALAEWTGRLREVNERLWEVEDRLRACERRQEFGEEFIQFARSVYRLNDERASIKRAINEHLGSPLVEEKCYEQTG